MAMILWTTGGVASRFCSRPNASPQPFFLTSPWQHQTARLLSVSLCVLCGSPKKAQSSSTQSYSHKTACGICTSSGGIQMRPPLCSILNADTTPAPSFSHHYANTRLPRRLFCTGSHEVNVTAQAMRHFGIMQGVAPPISSRTGIFNPVSHSH